MKKIIFFALLLPQFSFAQDPAFSQPYTNPLYLNPAFAGTGAQQRICANFRDQWPAIPGNYITYSLSYDRNIIDSNFGIGVLAEQDRAGQGTFITTNISLIAAYRFHIKSFNLSAGLQFTYLNKYLNQNLLFGDQIDPTRGFIYNSTFPTISSVNVPDFSAGLLGYGKNYFIGFSLNHITQPNESFISGGTGNPLPIKLVSNVGFIIRVGSICITPTLLYLKQQYFNEGMLQCYFEYKGFTTGIGNLYNVTNVPGTLAKAPSNNAVTFILGYQNKLFRLSYSYDYYTYPDNTTGGTHEVSLGFFLHYKSAKLKKVSGLNCPML